MVFTELPCFKGRGILITESGEATEGAQRGSLTQTFPGAERQTFCTRSKGYGLDLGQLYFGVTRVFSFVQCPRRLLFGKADGSL